MDDEPTTGEQDDTTGVAADVYRGPIVRMGVETGDGRIIDIGALTHRDLPLPYQFTDETTAGHMGAFNAGVIESLEFVDGDGFQDVIADIRFDLDSEAGKLAAHKVDGGFVRGVSVDLDMLEYEERTESGQVIESYDDLVDTLESGERIVFAVTKARIMGVTGVPFPAFQEAQIVPLSEIETEALVASAGSQVEGEAVRFNLPFVEGAWGVDSGEALVASAGNPIGTAFDIPVELDEEWFDYPQQTPEHVYNLRVDSDGKIHGYLSGTDPHISVGRKAPRTAVDFAKFYTGTHICSNGRTIPVGRILLATAHPNLKVNAADAKHWYDNTGSIVGYAQAYEDSNGIFLAGGVKAGATVEQVSDLRGADVSGDWRNFPDSPNQEMIVALAVGAGGFNKGNEAEIRALEAEYMAHEDQRLALVASAGLHFGHRSLVVKGEPMAATGLGQLTHANTAKARIEQMFADAQDMIAKLSDRVDVLEADKAQAEALEAQAKADAATEAHAQAMETLRARVRNTETTDN